MLRFSKLILRLRVGLLHRGVGIGRGGEGWDCPLGVPGAVPHADSAFGVHIAASGAPGGGGWMSSQVSAVSGVEEKTWNEAGVGSRYRCGGLEIGMKIMRNGDE